MQHTYMYLINQNLTQVKSRDIDSNLYVRIYKSRLEGK